MQRENKNQRMLVSLGILFSKGAHTNEPTIIQHQNGTHFKLMQVHNYTHTHTQIHQIIKKKKKLNTFIFQKFEYYILLAKHYF